MSFWCMNEPAPLIDALSIRNEFQIRDTSLTAKTAPAYMAQVYRDLTEVFHPFLRQTFPRIMIVAVTEEENGDVVLYQGPPRNPSKYGVIKKQFLDDPSRFVK